jgi:hypothetical protein
MKVYLPKIIYGMLAGCFGYIAFIGLYCFYLAMAGTPDGVSPMKVWLSMIIQGDWVFSILGGFVGFIWALLDCPNRKNKNRLPA